jgi:hypothetical protein
MDIKVKTKKVDMGGATVVTGVEAVPEKKASPVEQELTALAGACNALEVRVHELARRLMPVLCAVEAEKGGPGAPVVTASCSLIEALRARTADIDTIAAVVDTTIGRLEL